eukprot:359660-Chlamydomonas_euryale.AAC.9
MACMVNMPVGVGSLSVNICPVQREKVRLSNTAGTPRTCGYAQDCDIMHCNMLHDFNLARDKIEHHVVLFDSSFIQQHQASADPGVSCLHVCMQIFFHDPDNNMIEVCNCDDLPVVLLNNCQTCSVAAWERGQATKMDMGESGSRSIRNSSESVTMPLVLDAAMSMCSDMSMVMERV